VIRRAIAGCIVVAFASSAVVAGPDPKKTPAPKKDPKNPPATPAPPPEPPKPFPTGADKRRIIGILDVRIDGASTEIGSQFQKDLEAQVDIKHYFLAPRSRMKDILANSTKWTEGCVVGPCLKELRSQTNADVVLLAALTGSGTSFGWVVTLVRTDSGNVLGQKSERCDVCTVSEALSASTLAVVDLLSSLPDKLPDETVRKDVVPPPVDTAPLEAKVTSLEHRHTRTGLVLTVAGLAVAAAGVAYYFASSPHPNAGLATAAAGGGLLLGGVVVLTF
jgi:hypothetical protein